MALKNVILTSATDFEDEGDAEALYEAQLKAVIRLMARRYKGAVDYNMREDETVEVLDRNDTVLAVITSDELTRLWNAVE